MINPLELTAEQQEEIFRENNIEGFEYEIEEELDWEDDGKYQFGGCVFKHNDKFYLINVTRSGSYFSDYEFQFGDKVREVKKIQVIKEEWKNV